MQIIRELFDKSKPIDRRIEKVITYETTDEDLLKHEVQEYVATESIEMHFERLLDQMEEGMSGNENVEIGVWVSGFYGSGKSSFTKYLGFALDPTRKIGGKPFLEWLQNQFKSNVLRARLATVAKKHPAAVIMLDLASEQLAGATMAEISTVLYAKVMQWAGYSRDEKIAYLEFMLERDGKLDNFKKRISELAKGQTWDEVKNQPLVTKALASKVASEFYPDIFPDSKTFNEIKIEERIHENERVEQMLELIKRRVDAENIIFILDEVGQYVAARDNLILNLDGLAKNIKRLGHGHAWIIATAQQTLTEDDPRAATNTAKLFKLRDRFPFPIDLEAKDIKEICYTRLLSKSKDGEAHTMKLFENYGPQLRHAVGLKNTRYYKADLDKEAFCKYYPFLPHHFDILMELLSRLAKTRGGVGLRSAIKVIQDILVDPDNTRKGTTLLADDQIGKLATTVHFYDTLHKDIEKPFPHITEGVTKVGRVFGEAGLHVQVAKSIAVVQILEDFPVSRENLAALMHPSVDSASLDDDVSKSVEELLKDDSVPLNEVDGGLRFMSEAVNDLEQERLKILPTTADRRRIHNKALQEIFTPLPAVKLHGTTQVSTGLKVYVGAMPVGLAGDKEAIQTHIDLVPESEYDRRKQERTLESQQPSNKNTIFLLGHEDPEVDNIIVDIHRCTEIHSQNRNKTVDKDVEQYLRAQNQRAENLHKDLLNRLQKALTAGSFICRGKPRAVTELDNKIHEAARKYLDDIAKEVFERYSEAAVPADTGTAERFLKTEKLDRVASKDDPLSLVRKSGASSVIDIDHKALISLKDYLELHGQVDGRKLMDDFFAAPYRWSKDTTRYLVAAMLVAGLIKLRASGEDITVRGEQAINGLKNTNSFNKVGIALRGIRPSPESLLRAKGRLIELTGDDVMPLEEAVSKCVIKHFPDFQQDYAPLAMQLESLGLEGSERARNVQDNLAEILKGDASDATLRLGAEDCPFYNDLRWASEVKNAFDNGIETIIRHARELLKDIPGLPNVGTLGKLLSNTATLRAELGEYVSRADFHNYNSDIQNRLTEISNHVENTVKELLQEQSDALEKQISRIQSVSEWGRMGPDEQNRLANELDTLTIDVRHNLEGLQQLLAHQYLVSQMLQRIENEVRELAKEAEQGGEEAEDVVIQLPQILQSVDDLNALVDQLKSLKEKLETGQKLKIIWR